MSSLYGIRRSYIEIILNGALVLACFANTFMNKTLSSNESLASIVIGLYGLFVVGQMMGQTLRRWSISELIWTAGGFYVIWLILRPYLLGYL